VPQHLSGQQKRDNCNDSNDEMKAAQHERDAYYHEGSK